MSVVKYSAPCMMVSKANAMKRLPTPASGSSSAICSGVSMINRSSGDTL